MDQDRNDASLGLGQAITRRDFVGTTLAAAGATALSAPAPGVIRSARAQGLAADWTGYGGIGDYADANGNTADVVNAAHRIRDGDYESYSSAEDTGEIYDLVVVGGGIAGLAAAYAFFQQENETKKCLIIEDHPIFGGEAKGNVFKVDGHVLEAPQGSNVTSIPAAPPLSETWKELRLPQQVSFVEPTESTLSGTIADDHYSNMLWSQGSVNTGYYLKDDNGQEGSWIKNPWQDGLSKLPWPDQAKADLISWFSSSALAAPNDGADTAGWLDRMSYADFIQNVMKLDKEAIAQYADPIIAISIGGLGSDAISAYGAGRIMLPGFASPQERNDLAARGFSFPMGNAVIARHIVKAMIPEAYRDHSFEGVSRGRTRMKRLDRQGAKVRIRSAATVTYVRHDGCPDDAETVTVQYAKNGRAFQLKARAVVMASGGWVNRRVVRDMPKEILDAYYSFNHAPILVVNVAVNNWRFMDKLGISAARWFDGLGLHTNLRRPMQLESKHPTFSPDTPTVLTSYVAFPQRGRPVSEQATLGREALFRTSYADYERQIRAQFQEMFGPAGFDAKTDIAGLILNRWGHAYVVPEPGFYFGRDGKPAARDIIRKGFGRISFGHSELEGNQNWVAAFDEGTRAAVQVLAL